MLVLTLLLGAIIGGAFSGVAGALVGALLGYCLFTLRTLHNKLTYLEQELKLSHMRDTPAPTGQSAQTVQTPARADNRSAPKPWQNIPDTSNFSFEESGEQHPMTGNRTTPQQAATTPVRNPEPHLTTASTRHDTPAPQLLTEKLQSFFSGGNLLVKVGVIILFFGIAFLVKYAAEHALLPIELRLLAATLAGIALLVIGWRLRSKRPAYSQALQGGGVGILYLTTFAALRLYALIPSALAFLVLVAVAALSASMAVLQNSRSLAILGASGGFLAPILTSTGSGSHVALFSYYALLNFGIAGIAWFRSWRLLNLIGFIFTFAISCTWGWRYYRPEYFSTTEPFLIIFFLLYTFIAVLFALRQEPNLKGLLDGTLVFGTPIIAFSLQALLVKGYPFGLAWSALGLGLFYLPLAWLLFLKRPAFMRTLSEAFLALGVLFGTLTIPLALDSRWTSAAWALEGAALIWVGLKQDRRLPRLTGILLQIAAGIAFMDDGRNFSGTTPILNGFFLGVTVLAGSGFVAAYCYNRYRTARSAIEPLLGHLLLAWGILWWLSGGITEIDRFGTDSYRMGSVLLFLTLTMTTCSYLTKRLAWPALAWPALALLPTLYLCTLALIADNGHPFAQGCWALWPLALAAYYLILSRNEDKNPYVLRLLHAATYWLITALCTVELAWQADNWITGATTWPLAAVGFVPALSLLLLFTAGRRLSWPIGRYRDTYYTLGAIPVAIVSLVWIWAANLSASGNAAPLPYLPLLNPLDLTVLFVAIALGTGLTQGRTCLPGLLCKPSLTSPVGIVAASTLFLWLNGILIRTVHHWGGVPFSPAPLFHSLLIQSALSIFWSILALCIMVYATSSSQRVVWQTGACLLGLVVCKLFLIDLSGTGTVARIVSFVGVGILLLIIGYFTPAPPRSHQETVP
jgi:uncharacterized membrane protein